MNKILLINAMLFSIIILISCKSTRLTKEQEVLLSHSTRTIKILPSKIEVDKLGNLYVIDVNYQLSLFNQTGVQKYKYSEKRYGAIHSIDVSNPLKILVYHKDFNLIRILDNTLNIAETISLNTNNKFSTVTLASWSNDGNFWIFDDLQQKIFKINRSLEILVESNRFNDLGLVNYQPQKLVERENTLVINGAGSDFILFDNFGQMTKKIEAAHAKDFNFDGTSILYLTDTGLKNQAINYPSYTAIGLPNKITSTSIENIKLENDKWYIMYKDGVDIVERNRRK